MAPNINDRYVLAAFTDGAVLLDLRGGGFFRLNASAASICRGLVRGQTADAIARDFAAAFALDAAAARRDVETVLAEVGSAPPAASRNPITFQPDGAGNILHWQGRPIWHIGADGRQLRYLADPSKVETDRRTQLLWVAPHLLRLRHRSVLHASAVVREGKVSAFIGSSGRGKSTLTRRLAVHGMKRIADDLALLALDTDRPEVVLDGEAVLCGWAEEQAAELGTGKEIPTDPLDRAFAGARLPLGKVHFLQRVEAAAPEIAERPLGRADALGLLLENSFAELGWPEVWRQLWEENVRLVASVPMVRAEVPEGLERLEAAVGRYASR